MKKYFAWLIFCLIAIVVLFGIELVSRISELEKLDDLRLYQLEQKLEEQEKEIRLLKSDVIFIDSEND